MILIQWNDIVSSKSYQNHIFLDSVGFSVRVKKVFCKIR